MNSRLHSQKGAVHRLLGPTIFCSACTCTEKCNIINGMRKGATHRFFLIAICGGIGAFLGFHAVQSIVRVWVPTAGTENTAHRILYLDKFYTRIGTASGTAPPPQNDESIAVKIEDPLVRGEKSELEVRFVKNDSFFIPGEFRRVRLTGLKGRNLEAKTVCVDVEGAPEVACIAAGNDPTNEIKTGWFFEPSGPSERFSLDFTQYPEELPERISDLTSNYEALDRYDSDQFVKLVLKSGEEEIILDEEKPMGNTTNGASVRFNNKQMDLGRIPTVNQIGLTSLQESLLKFAGGIFGVLFGSGLVWRILDRRDKTPGAT